MRRLVGLLALVATITSLNVECVQAGWNEFWGHVPMTYARNKAWPQPWLHEDQTIVRQTFAPMVQRGWQMQNTLTHEHFDLATDQLNSAGMLKVKHILRNSPPDRQTIFVFSDYGDVASSHRLDAVRNQLNEWLPQHTAPEVVQSFSKPRGVSGSYADTITRKWEAGIPTPRLTGSSGSSSIGSGGN